MSTITRDYIPLFEVKYYCTQKKEIVTEFIFFYVENFQGLIFKRRKTGEIITVSYANKMYVREI
jgi:hypothetical protein